MKNERFNDKVLELIRSNRSILGVKGGFRWGKYRTYECFSKKGRYLVLYTQHTARFATLIEVENYFVDTLESIEGRKNRGFSHSNGITLLKRLNLKVSFCAKHGLFLKHFRVLRKKRSLKGVFVATSFLSSRYSLNIKLNEAYVHDRTCTFKKNNTDKVVYLKIGKRRLLLLKDGIFSKLLSYPSKD